MALDQYFLLGYILKVNMQLLSILIYTNCETLKVSDVIDSESDSY